MKYPRALTILCSLCLTCQMMVSARISSHNNLPCHSEVLSGYDEAEVRERLDKLDLQAIEGLWSYPQEQMLVVIERFTSPNISKKIGYRMVMVSAEDLSLLPGTVIGYLEKSALDNKYQLWLYSEQCGTELENIQKSVATLSEDDGTITFTRSEWTAKVRINFSRFLPNLFRGISIVPEKKGETLPEGFKRIYPISGNVNGNNEPIRYL